MTGPASPSPRPLPRWLPAAVLTLLTAQVGLLWMQGTMLERQHGDLQSLRQDVQDLSENLEQFEGTFDQEGTSDSFVRPSAYHRRHARRPVRVRLDEPEGDQGVRKEMKDQRQSERDAINQARDAQSKLSLQENARKADEKAKLEAEAHPLRPLIGLGFALALVALFVRSWLRKRG